MNPLLMELLGVAFRWLITSIGAYLVAHHVVNADQEARFADGALKYLLEHAVIWSPLVGGLLLGLWSKYKSRIKFLTALQAPAGTSEASVKAKIENGMGASVKVGGVLLACILAGAATSACGPKQMHTAVVANTSIAQAIFALQDAEIAAHQANLITDAKHAEYKGQILQLLQAGDDLTLALKAWDPSQPAPANIGRAIGNVQKLLADLKVDSPQATQLLFAVQTVLSVLRGSGVLPSDDQDAHADRWRQSLWAMRSNNDGEATAKRRFIERHALILVPCKIGQFLKGEQSSRLDVTHNFEVGPVAAHQPVVPDLFIAGQCGAIVGHHLAADVSEFLNRSDRSVNIHGAILHLEVA